MNWFCPALPSALTAESGSMSFAISPSDYLRFLEEELGEFQNDRLVLRKAIRVSFFANHLPEHVFEAYHVTDPAKVEGCTTAQSYLERLVEMKPELVIVKDLCEFSKHVVLTRKKNHSSGSSVN